MDKRKEYELLFNAINQLADMFYENNVITVKLSEQFVEIVKQVPKKYIENLAIGTAAVVATRLKCKDNFERDMVDLSMAILYEITEIM